MTGSQSNNGEDGDTQVTFWEAIAPNCSSVYVQTEADTGFLFLTNPNNHNSFDHLLWQCKVTVQYCGV